MPTTSFTKNFEVSRQNASAFTKLMTSPAKPLLNKNFKSSFRNLNHDSKLRQQLKEAINNMSNY